jgi:hypothetical protein
MPDSVMDLATEKPFYFESMLSVLGYREDGEWVALVLEMDLRGYGATWEEALDEVRELALMQTSFAHEKGQPEMIWKDAEPQYWEQFRRAQRAGVVAPAGETASGRPELHAGVLKLPPPHAADENRFAPANG